MVLNIMLCLSCMSKATDKARRATNYREERINSLHYAYIIWFFLGYTGSHRFYLQGNFKSYLIGCAQCILFTAGVGCVYDGMNAWHDPSGFEVISGICLLSLLCVLYFMDLHYIPLMVEDYYDTKYRDECFAHDVESRMSTSLLSSTMPNIFVVPTNSKDMPVTGYACDRR